MEIERGPRDLPTIFDGGLLGAAVIKIYKDLLLFVV